MIFPFTWRHFPRLITTYEHEVWVEFVEGERIHGIDEQLVRAVAEFYGDVYAREASLVPLVETPFDARLRSDLRFLHEVEVIDDAAYRDLSAAAERLAPERVWVGFDYTDAVLKNFIVRPATSILHAHRKFAS